jgi:hypothetical protein
MRESRCATVGYASALGALGVLRDLGAQWVRRPDCACRGAGRCILVVVDRARAMRPLGYHAIRGLAHGAAASTNLAELVAMGAVVVVAQEVAQQRVRTEHASVTRRQLACGLVAIVLGSLVAGGCGSSAGGRSDGRLTAAQVQGRARSICDSASRAPNQAFAEIGAGGRGTRTAAQMVRYFTAVVGATRLIDARLARLRLRVHHCPVGRAHCGQRTRGATRAARRRATGSSTSEYPSHQRDAASTERNFSRPPAKQL